MQTLRESIAAALADFPAKPLREAATNLFRTLGYQSDRTVNLGSVENFLSTYDHDGSRLKGFAPRLNWKSVELLFQLTDDDVVSAASGEQTLAFDSKGTFGAAIMESYVFLAVELSPLAKKLTRTDLASLTRAINRLFAMPVLILFRHGASATLSVINRRLSKKDTSRDVLEKVTLIKDISLTRPHRAHVEILGDLSLASLQNSHGFSNFVTLHAAWQKTLNIQTLNQDFFIKIRNWFYWARLHAKFPPDATKDADGRDSEALIRLLTRLIFCWFLREKGLIPDNLFASDKIKTFLAGWHPDQADTDRDGRYYKAILQNLFFATLATPVDKRKFRTSRTFQGKNKHYGDHQYFRHVELFQEKAPVEEIYKTIPFLNGGLFECLDETPSEENGLTEEIRVDGFSDTAKSQAIVPDFLFFGSERPAPELCHVLDETTAPKVRGLIHIFNDYKFTIQENTPLEEVIALDPELLGRSFENLLAAINPETGATARKSTGSFYTPREIVHYMVEESLYRHLHHRFAEQNLDRPDLERDLRELVSEIHETHRLNPRESEAAVAILSQLKILDPACGSGAFPMGLLQLLVQTLKKLDEDNECWKTAKLALLPPEMRDKAAEVFRDEPFDYTRKLELIRDCIHGVDIQPIAIQISKLRFFLSLVIEQLDDAPIRPLPNLETKFVCANSLIGLTKPEGWELFQHQIEPREKALLAVRSRYFFARTKEEKEACKTEDRRLRREISSFVKDIGGHLADQLSSAIAEWDPYRSDRRASYFDPESMFGVPVGKVIRRSPVTLGGGFSALLTDELTPQTEEIAGFDITIGNPPYVRADEQSEWNQVQRQAILASKQYHTLWEKWDLFVPFIERSYQLLRPGGISTMIVSDAFCHSKYAEKAQNWYLKHARILRLDFCGEVRIFDAAVHNIITFLQKAEGADHTPDRHLHRETFGNITPLPSDKQAKLTQRVFFPEDTVSQAFDCPTKLLQELCYISKGMVVHADEKQAKGAFELRDLVSDSQDRTHPKPFVEGKHLERWLPTDQKWLEWGTKRAPALFSRPTFSEIYEVPEKIISVDMSAGTKKLRVVYDDKQLYHNHSAWSFVPWHSLNGVRNKSLKNVARYQGEKPPRADLPKREELEATSRRFSLKFLLGVMNSSTARDFLRANRRSNIHLYPDDWKNLPISDVDATKQQGVVQVVELILALHTYFAANPGHKSAEDHVYLEFLEHLNDALCKELYYPSKLHEKKLFIQKITQESDFPITPKASDQKDLTKIREKLEALTDINHPLRTALYEISSLELMEKETEAT